MTQRRAAKGGEIGANGERYEGGRFINTIAENPKKEGSRPRKARKSEVAPFVWELTPEGKSSIYQAFAGVFGKVGVDGRAFFAASEQTLSYYGTTRESAESLIARWNAGERWI